MTSRPYTLKGQNSLFLLTGGLVSSRAIFGSQMADMYSRGNYTDPKSKFDLIILLKILI